MCASFDEPFDVGEAAARSGVNTNLIRHYESLDLLPKAVRTGSGHREYTESDVHTLRFVRRGRALGFSMADIAELLALWQNNCRASSQVKRIALAHAEDLTRRIEELEGMRRSLERLAHCCRGDQRPDCPIIDEFAELTGFAGCHEAPSFRER